MTDATRSNREARAALAAHARRTVWIRIGEAAAPDGGPDAELRLALTAPRGRSQLRVLRSLHELSERDPASEEWWEAVERLARCAVRECCPGLGDDESVDEVAPYLLDPGVQVDLIEAIRELLRPGARAGDAEEAAAAEGVGADPLPFSSRDGPATG